MEQVREFDGEQAYEKMRRAVGEGKPAGEDLAVSVAQKAGVPWGGAGLWPQPLILGGCPRKNADPMQQEDWPN